MHVCDYCVGIHSQLGLGIVSGDRPGARRTHIEDMEDPVEIRFPGGDSPRIILRVEESGDRIPPTPFHDAPLNLCNSPGIGG